MFLIKQKHFSSHSTADIHHKVISSVANKPQTAVNQIGGLLKTSVAVWPPEVVQQFTHSKLHLHQEKQRVLIELVFVHFGESIRRTVASHQSPF